MKAKLLKKLRHKYARKYTICRCADGWSVYYGHGFFDRWKYKSIELAKERFIISVRSDILDYVSKHRRLKHSISYYPW